MRDLWLEFDSLNQKITSRKYSFEPYIKDFTLRNATTNDVSRIREISDAELGKNYLDETIKNAIQSNKTIFRIAESANKGVVGFSYSYIAEAKEIIPKLGIKKPPKSFENSSEIVVLKTIAVKTNVKQRGIGSSLIKDSLDLFKRQKIESIYCVAWKSKKGINLEGLMHLHKFKLYDEIPNFWTEDSKKKGYLCPECGNPCECAAVIYTKTI